MRARTSRRSTVSALSALTATIRPFSNFKRPCLGVSRSLRDNGNATTFGVLLLPMAIAPFMCPRLISQPAARRVKLARERLPVLNSAGRQGCIGGPGTPLEARRRPGIFPAARAALFRVSAYNGAPLLSRFRCSAGAECVRRPFLASPGIGADGVPGEGLAKRPDRARHLMRGGNGGLE